MDAATREQRLLRCLDLTALAGGLAGRQAVGALCARAKTAAGAVAAVCVLPECVATAREALDRHGAEAVKVATVANFPTGDGAPAAVAAEIRAAIAAGADELDVVLPYRAVPHEPGRVRALLDAVRDAAGEQVLKVILETGALAEPDRIRHAADLAIDGGADFLKTSTGRAAIGATPEAARLLLRAIAHAGGHCGLKVSGGIRTVAEAAAYLDLAVAMMGDQWPRPTHFRIGASALYDALLAALAAAAPPEQGPGP